jgi:hypothetical protein
MKTFQVSQPKPEIPSKAAEPYQTMAALVNAVKASSTVNSMSSTVILSGPRPKYRQNMPSSSACNVRKEPGERRCCKPGQTSHCSPQIFESQVTKQICPN